MRIWLASIILAVTSISSGVFAGDPSLATPAEQTRNSTVVAYYNCKTGTKVADASEVKQSDKAARIEVAAGGFCELDQNPDGTYYCRQGSCDGTCTLRTIPLYCRCE